MGLANDIRAEVKQTFSKQWEKRDGNKVPDTDDIALGNAAVVLKGTILYADLVESTLMVNSQQQHFAAEIYKTFLLTACKIIRDQGGTITAFDGDRVMAVYLGDNKNSAAAKSALKINWAVDKIINTELVAQYPNSDYRVKQAVGIDTSDLWVARTGIRGSNDLVWVGRAANYAAKLCSLRTGSSVSWITKDVFDVLNKEVKYGPNEQPMWQQSYWSAYNCYVFSSSWNWSID
ncbi:MAG: adenylate/guanylate cyclase [Candidatus Edwardsbacteria bacterium RIFOXYD12_FULL_50_11]|uniref:Adenylate/guanylate cyclase n=1 Tax=Candidatus Edwardsbacteria bacterium GWF2_54_11 TaxID=1817851 RepID=A0A1F5R7Z3_9BACT|nr:MAG: adenylate/guanylate cyclase [Candidatus Edwardsbacteria bacterium RifOxyC12_full_54_24]OGF08029.1 MAG: adenylate/guanylate cyclase [Candidatus Edwardsbacteria bacterium RifOxyA12_full_54_48]OGF10278.1 MAG: adenylate/guanylate cyclase [Candidatus Edwardsbacteria bacterium GWE2_54_12]OGF10559.1 MAG: adenylate/guanylate cyclase [Candidatus Edwardsbacteria bacterium GWF2_54_11]OGF15153.1 MAG: adenylate/guanylate cyclase [Candidatus Edwardsbacteria bacterium RIFOXYD12_FULL_50_11]OGJ19795.1 